MENKIMSTALQTQKTAEQSNEVSKEQILLMLGATGAMSHIARNINSTVIKALQRIRDEKIYRSLGFQTFEGFLDEYEYAPMRYKKFNYIEKQFEIEGDDAFDSLNQFGIPMSKRKLLGKGNIQLDGDKIIVIDPATKEEISFDAGDKSRILETITALADANADKSKKLEIGKQDHERLKSQLKHVEEVLDTERQSSSARNHDEIETCYMVIGSTMKRLNLLLEDAALVRVAGFEDRNLRVLAAQYQRLNEIIAAKLPGANTGAALDDEEEDRLASLLDDED